MLFENSTLEWVTMGWLEEWWGGVGCGVSSSGMLWSLGAIEGGGGIKY